MKFESSKPILGTPTLTVFDPKKKVDTESPPSQPTVKEESKPVGEK